MLLRDILNITKEQKTINPTKCRESFEVRKKTGGTVQREHKYWQGATQHNIRTKETSGGNTKEESEEELSDSHLR